MNDNPTTTPAPAPVRVASRKDLEALGPEPELRGADMIGADLADADLRGADLTGAVLSSTEEDS